MKHIVKKYRSAAVITSLAAIAACGPSEDDITAACVEMGETRKMDGAVRIRMLRELEIPADDLQLVHTLLEIRFEKGEGVKGCTELLSRELGVRAATSTSKPIQKGYNFENEYVRSNAPKLASPILLESKLEIPIRILRHGDGAAAKAKQYAVIVEKKWKFDPDAPDNRGKPVESSENNELKLMSFSGLESETYQKWINGESWSAYVSLMINGMRVGEIREAILPPESGIWSGVPDTVLVYEIELLGLADSSSDL